MAEPHRKRQRYFKVHLLDEELAVLAAKADEAVQSKSEYMRNMILFGAAHRRANFKPEDVETLRYEINRIGNNVNQVAYHVNTDDNFDEERFMKLYDEYINLLSLFDKYVQQ